MLPHEYAPTQGVDMKKIFVTIVIGIMGSSIQAMACPQLGDFNYKCTESDGTESSISIKQSIRKDTCTSPDEGISSIKKDVHSFVVKSGRREILKFEAADGVGCVTRDTDEGISTVGSCEGEALLRAVMTMDLGEFGKGGNDVTFTKVSKSKIKIVTKEFGEAGDDESTVECVKKNK